MFHKLTSSASNDIPALHGVRAIASLMVMWYHYTLFLGPNMISEDSGAWHVLGDFFKNFWSGVDLFFVLSGFLIAKGLFQYQKKYQVLGIPRFFIRRAFRIFPIYYVLLFLSLSGLSIFGLSGAYPLLFRTSDAELLLENSWSHFFYLSNYVLGYHEANLFSWGWSLCVEEHFYIMLPFVLWGMRKLGLQGQQRVLWVLFFIPLGLRVLHYIWFPSEHLLQGFYYWSHVRFDGLWLGVLLAWFYCHHHSQLREGAEQYSFVISRFAGVCFFAVWYWGSLDKVTAFTVVAQFSLAALGSVLLLMNALFLENRVRDVLAMRCWVPVARLSYASYLIHPFVVISILEGTKHVGFEVQGLGLFLLGFLLTFVLTCLLACFSFYLVEFPMQRLGRRLVA